MPRLSAILLSTISLAPGAHAAPLEAPALVRSKSRLELRSTLGVPVLNAPLRDGARFAKGDVLVSFDCRTLKAERSAAGAAAKAASLEATSKKKLLRHGAVGKGEWQRADALYRQARSQRDAITARMRACSFAAPFAGRVVAVSARSGELPAANRPVITVIDDRRLEIEIVAPSRWLAWIEVNAPFAFAVEETGANLFGRVNAIGSEVDPVSRTVRLFGTIKPNKRVLPGMSGTATFSEPAR